MGKDQSNTSSGSVAHANIVTLFPCIKKYSVGFIMFFMFSSAAFI